MTIHNTKELRDAYSWLRLWEQLLATKAPDDDTRPIVLDRIAEQKRDIRRYHNRPDIGRYAIRDDGDSAIVVLPLPEDITTKEEAERFFRENEYIEYRPTYYDCTGQLFTSWHSILRRAGRWYLYHCISRDV